MRTTFRTGAYLRVGDKVHVWWGVTTIKGFSPHPGITYEGRHYPCRIAHTEGGTDFTIEEDARYTITDQRTPARHAWTETMIRRMNRWRPDVQNHPYKVAALIAELRRGYQCFLLNPDSQSMADSVNALIALLKEVRVCPLDYVQAQTASQSCYGPLPTMMSPQCV